jgi:hypothetical protein
MKITPEIVPGFNDFLKEVVLNEKYKNNNFSFKLE